MTDYECIVHMTFEESGIKDFRCRELALTTSEAVGKCRDRLRKAWPDLIEISETFKTIPVDSVPITAKPYVGDNLRGVRPDPPCHRRRATRDVSGVAGQRLEVA